MKILRKFTPPLISLAALLYVVYFIEPPSSWEMATTTQILIFFIPLLLTISFLANIFIDYLPKSFSIGIGFMLLTTLKALNQLNFLTGGGAILVTILLFIFIKKPQAKREPKIIPKLKNLK